MTVMGRCHTLYGQKYVSYKTFNALLEENKAVTGWCDKAAAPNVGSTSYSPYLP